MRNFIILMAALLSTAASASESGTSEAPKEFLDLFPSNPIACPEGVPDDCTCGEFENLTELPMRYTRFQGCPHPVLGDVVNIKTFTRVPATAARFTPRHQITDDLMMKAGELHGAAVSWHPNGQINAVASYDEGKQVGHARSWHENGQRAAEQFYEDGELHGEEFRFSTEGELLWVIVWDHGNVDREETRRISRKLGIEAPFDRARPNASNDDEGRSE